MIKLADIGYNKSIKFFQMGIYDLLKTKLGFRFSKINGKGYYLKENNGIYERVPFIRLSADFKAYIEKEFESLEISNEIEFSNFMEAYYKYRPIKKGNYSREYLSEDFELSEYNLHLLLLDVDPKYKFNFEEQEMLTFLDSEKFIKTIDDIGNFSKNRPLYYKKTSVDKYLIFSQPYGKSKNEQSTFDFWKVKSTLVKEFLKEKPEKQIKIKLGFNLTRDLELYEIEKEKSTW